MDLKIENFESLGNKLKAMEKKAKQTANKVVVVGFSQSYAVYVHEDPDAQHGEGKAYKYLEDPARRLNNDGTLSLVASEVYKKHLDLGKALLVAGLRIQRAAQKIVPIDTGALKASAFTDYEENLDQAAAKAQALGNARKNKKKKKK